MTKIKQILKKKAVIAALFFITALAGFLIFAWNYEIPLPFDGYRMSVEVRPAVVVTDDEGRVGLKEIADIDDEELEEYDEIIDVVGISHKGLYQITQSMVGKNISRNGEDVRVVYYCHGKTLWNSLFFDGDLVDYSEAGWGTGGPIYGENYLSPDYEPQMIEIYYLPMRNLYKIQTLSDDEFDSLREKATLVWSGVS